MDQTPEAVRNVTLRVRFVGDEGLFVGDEVPVIRAHAWRRHSSAAPKATYQKMWKHHNIFNHASCCQRQPSRAV